MFHVVSKSKNMFNQHDALFIYIFQCTVSGRHGVGGPRVLNHVTKVIYLDQGHVPSQHRKMGVVLVMEIIWK